MTIRFALSGTIVAESSSNLVPSVGDKVTIRTNAYKKGLNAGSLISFSVDAAFPPSYDYSEGSEPIVYIDVDNYEILENGPE